MIICLVNKKVLLTFLLVIFYPAIAKKIILRTFCHFERAYYYWTPPVCSGLTKKG